MFWRCVSGHRGHSTNPVAAFSLCSVGCAPISQLHIGSLLMSMGHLALLLLPLPLCWSFSAWRLFWFLILRCLKSDRFKCLIATFSNLAASYCSVHLLWHTRLSKQHNQCLANSIFNQKYIHLLPFFYSAVLWITFWEGFSNLLRATKPFKYAFRQFKTLVGDPWSRYMPARSSWHFKAVQSQFTIVASRDLLVAELVYILEASKRIHVHCTHCPILYSVESISLINQLRNGQRLLSNFRSAQGHFRWERAQKRCDKSIHEFAWVVPVEWDQVVPPTIDGLPYSSLTFCCIPLSIWCAAYRKLAMKWHPVRGSSCSIKDITDEVFMQSKAQPGWQTKDRRFVTLLYCFGAG